jgi:hypothetical protein
MTKSEFKDKLIHFSSLIRAVVSLIEVFRFYRTKDELKAHEITKMVMSLLDLDAAEFHGFDEFVQENWEGYATNDDEMMDLLKIYGDLKAQEIQTLEVFKDDNLLENNSFPNE